MYHNPLIASQLPRAEERRLQDEEEALIQAARQAQADRTQHPPPLPDPQAGHYQHPLHQAAKEREHQQPSPFPRHLDPRFHDQVQQFRAGVPVSGERLDPPLKGKQPEWQVFKEYYSDDDTLPVHTTEADYETTIAPRIAPWETSGPFVTAGGNPYFRNNMERLIPHSVATDPRYAGLINSLVKEGRSRQETARRMGLPPYSMIGGLSPEQLLGIDQRIDPQKQYAYADNGRGGQAGIPKHVATVPIDANGETEGEIVEVDRTLGMPGQEFFDDSLASLQHFMGDGYKIQLGLDRNGRVVDKYMGPLGQPDGNTVGRKLDGRMGSTHSYGRDYPTRILEGMSGLAGRR